MVLKKSSQALEFPFVSLSKELTKLLTPELSYEASAFIERNSLGIIEESHEVHHIYCERCLKAHLLKTAKALLFPQKYLRELSRKFECEIGHSGYYTDSHQIYEAGEV